MKLTAFLAFLGFLGVALGAFGAHGLEERLSGEAKGWWETATFYLLVHAGLGTALGVQGQQWRMAVLALGVGSSIFAGTLYAMALGAPSWFGAITPLGGVLMLVGWALVAVRALGRKA